MASIILSTAGQAAGSLVGVPFASQIGAQLGGAIGRQIDGPTKRTYEGARLENLAVQTSTYGRMIPITFGTVRISGNVIWSRPIRELVTTTQTNSGGKGGGGSQSQSSTSTNYSYYVTLAIAVCEGEITRVDRVWADAKLLDLSQGTFRIYKGSETQMPDTLIESYQGVGATPAYRGLAYVVIEDFPLADFGNRIPNFTFEVTRRVSQQDDGSAPVESLVTSVMMVPGSGEFVYDPVTEYKYGGSGTTQSGYQTVINQHTPEGKANVEVALDQLQETFPNLEWVGVVVNWFGTTMNINDCEIWPCVEYQTAGATTPNSWSVAGMNRSTARQIGNDVGQIRYGGTPDDGSIVRLITAIQGRGLKVFFYPQMLMDIAGKPWRGYLTGAAADVNSFFTKTRGYNDFILHYANLVAGHVDAFSIGTEMRDLTKILGSTGVYPAVNKLVTLASSVKSILGSSVKVTYAADWSEYHHTDGGWYHLDPLWASSSIDVVGIDAYFPLTDAVQTGYDIDAIRDGWTSGEGYDFYYTDSARTTQASLSAPYAWKNLSWWWNNTHTDPSSVPTSWVPTSKPIWFTEYGFASVDGCTNEPNVFIDNTTSASALPRFSRGRVDFMAQRAAIAATELEWQGSSMVTQKFLWTWDARPYPYWPDLRHVWADGGNWVTGHWVQGKLGASHVSGAIQEIIRRAGLTASQVDATKVQAILDGFVLHERISARGAMEQLGQAFFFTVKEGAEKLIVMPHDVSIDATVDVGQCIPRKMGDQEVAYTIERKEDLVLPDRVEVQFLNRLQRYESHVESATRSIQSATDTAMVGLSLVLSETHARAIAAAILTNRWAERSVVNFQLPMAYANLEPGDVVSLADGALTYRVRLNKVQIGRPGVVRVSGVIDAAEVWDGYISPVAGADGAELTPNPVTRFEVMDMPALPGDDPDALILRVAACGLSQGWTGASVLRLSVGGSDQKLLDISTAATIGTVLTALPVGTMALFDRVNTLDVAIIGDATLSSATELHVLNGANVAMVGNEIIQFTNATLLSAGVYRLSGLLRGRQGTEAAMTGHVAGERFVLLDAAVTTLTVPLGTRGAIWNLRAVTFGDPMTQGAEAAVTIDGESLKPYAPVHVRAVRGSGGDITLSWVRRTRMDGGLQDYVDVPLRETSEQYDVEIWNGSTKLRSWRVSSNQQVYTATEQTADFGSAPATLSVVVAQVSGLVGQGIRAEQNVLVLQ